MREAWSALDCRGTYFSYFKGSQQCSLHASSARPIFFESAMAGPKRCQGLPSVYEPSADEMEAAVAGGSHFLSDEHLCGWIWHASYFGARAPGLWPSDYHKGRCKGRHTKITTITSWTLTHASSLLLACFAHERSWALVLVFHRIMEIGKI